MSEARAIELRIKWDDGIEHVYTRDPGGTWSMRLRGTPRPAVVVVGHKRADLERVMNTALEGTPTTDKLETGNGG